jgi:hypothetical protein
MTKYLPYHRYPNLDSYSIFFRGIPADLLDCFWAIDYEKSQYSGKAVWQVAFFRDISCEMAIDKLLSWIDLRLIK